jgi:hypothetical protein
MKKPPCKAAISESGSVIEPQKLGHLIPRIAKLVK